MSKSVQIKCDADIVQLAIKDIVSGSNIPPLPTHNKPPTGLNAANQYGYALLKSALFEMDAWEVGFAGSMVRVNALSDKQRNRLKTLVKNYLGIDVDYQETLDASAYAAADATLKAANSNTKKKPSTRKKAA
jgi:hypothetical protein